MQIPSNAVTWFELPADDINRASSFYSAVFGWSMSDMGGDSKYAQTADSDENSTPLKPGAINGDISPRTKDFDTTLVVINVDDIDAKLTQVLAAGGEVVMPRQHLPEMGIIYAIIKDTEGNKVGVVQSLS